MEVSFIHQCQTLSVQLTYNWMGSQVMIFEVAAACIAEDPFFLQIHYYFDG